MLAGTLGSTTTAVTQASPLLIGDALGDAHEHVFQVDFFFLEHLQAEAVLDQQSRR